MNKILLHPEAVGPVAAPVDSERTPAGLQSARALTRRRVFVAALNLVTLGLLALALSRIFGAGGWSAADIVIFVSFLFGAPWTIMGFWNAMIGLWLLHGARRGLAATSPFLAAGESATAPRTRTAIAMALRNEDAERALDKLVKTKRSLDAAGFGGGFDIFVLSDTDDPVLAAAEEAAFERRRAALGPGARYRRRARNTGFKAGNLRDFLRRWGRGYEFFLPLDSDSRMSGAAILRMVRIMEAHPRLGILQSLVVGAPATSAFARIFQFGMRAGMRSFTMGAAWWHGDCGPYWGHNALVRVAPFRAKCALPALPGAGPLGGHILSHDQIEAALMRRAGFEVRVMPVETESYEDNPPTLFDFTQRDLRWCQGNMQYWRLLGLKGLKPMSRFQVFAAIMMYFGGPAWMLMTAAAVAKINERDYADIDFAFAIPMFLVMFGVSLFPKIAGWIDIALRTGGAAAYGGRGRFIAGAVTETLFSMLLAPIVAFRVTIFLGGLAFGRRVGWSGQQRDARRLSWTTAIRGLWPQTLFGGGLAGIIALGAPSALTWAAPVLAGLCLAIPFAVLTSHPALARFATRVRLCAIPEEYAPAPAPVARAAA
ncbi:glucans biosynthesis glucosyltransferase MdoH [Pikeienuella piscinae]|uniref:Glucans biosynthesis glucosyltransferase H n=1 Tax=Pikeienuella piscinae TaxID=2748098 RepID=A0A7L5BWB3_9RHOB|nr:glucans biosynthesis glucosyltransferase MdoH [Pikeienuella piscinae]QIE55128.1 glucans biosynthesis glucosyltransferase MdoH [Pikeienuella piscinae]